MTLRDRLKLLLLSLCTVMLLACGAHGYHQVKKGETLYSISFTYGHDYRDVAMWNDIKQPYVIYQGDVLRVVTMAPASKPQQSAVKGSDNVPAVVTKVKTVPTVSQQANATTAKATVKTTTSLKPVIQKPIPKSAQQIQWQWPADGQLITTFLASQPARKGVNISGKHGAPIRAAASGKVVYSGNGLSRYGNLVIIKHNELYLSAYAHNDSLLVVEGDSVKAGKVIAKMGATGANKVMLHFEIRKKGKPVNPAAYLPRR